METTKWEGPVGKILWVINGNVFLQKNKCHYPLNNRIHLQLRFFKEPDMHNTWVNLNELLRNFHSYDKAYSLQLNR